MIEQFSARPNTEGWHYLRPQVLFLSDGQVHVVSNSGAELRIFLAQVARH